MNRDLSKANFIATRSALAELDLLSTKTTTTKQDETRIRFLLAKVAALRSGYDVDELNRADLLAATPDAPYGDPDAERRRIASDFARADHAVPGDALSTLPGTNRHDARKQTRTISCGRSSGAGKEHVPLGCEEGRNRKLSGNAS